MAPAAEGRLATDLTHALVPLKGAVRDDEALFATIGGAPLVLIAESTHGTHEFYRARTEITQRLIADRGFTAVCIEGTSSDALRLNGFVLGGGDDTQAVELLCGFKRFPGWVWQNAQFLQFVGWLREYNHTAYATRRPKARFYGLDLYGAYGSMDAVESAAMLHALEQRLDHLAAHQAVAKAVVWTHNSHVGDAAARRSFGDRAISIGFTTYTGTVCAASQWEALHERKQIAPARGDSYEYLFHSTNVPRFFLPLRPHRPKLGGLPQQARERAIGVVYHPQSEPHGNYFTASLIEQFDAVYHFDATRALEPLQALTERRLVSTAPGANGVEPMSEND